MGAVLALSLAAAAGVPATAQEAGRIELTPAVQQSLLHLQDLWIQWLAAFNQGNAERSGEVLSEVLATSRQLGMETVPDLAEAALVVGVAEARSGELAHARLALAAAERLAPGQPENAFARATVERLAGRWFHAASSWVAGYVRVLNHPRLRRLWLTDLGVEFLYVLLLAGVLFVCLQMAVRGRQLFAELSAVAGRRLPAWSVPPVVALLLLWPLLLPAGIAWLVLYWSVLLFTYGSTSERWVFGLLWLVAGLVPMASTQARQLVTLELAPPVLALEEVVEGRLYGSLFTDLALIEELLPAAPAVDHLLADLHRRLGQWERARTGYLRVLDAEPDNAGAMVDLGSYYFYKGDYGTALSRYRQAIEVAPEDALAYFNLSQTLSVEYLFEEGGRALEQAKVRVGSEGVERWMDETGEGSVLNANGGFARRDEIRDLLAKVLEGEDSEAARVVTLVRQTWSLMVALGLLVAAIAFHLWTGRRRRAVEMARPAVVRPGPWPRALVPGLAAAVEGRGFAALLGLALPALAALLAWHADLGFALPLRYAQAQPGPLVALGLLALLLAARAWFIVWRRA